MESVGARQQWQGREWMQQTNGGNTLERVLPERLHPGKDGYRASVSRAAPAHLRGSLDTLDRCILGISLGGGKPGNFHGAKLESIVRWIASRAKQCCVLVGDSLARLSLQAREGLEPAAAERYARVLGRSYVAETEALFRHYSTDQVSFVVKYGSEYAHHPDFGPYHERVRALYFEDAAFQQLVHAFGDKYLARVEQSASGGEARLERRGPQHVHAYLMEELALFACLAADGWPTLVYPGSIDSISEVAEGRYPALPAPLKAFQFVALRIHGKR